MKKDELLTHLHLNHKSFTDYIKKLSEEQFLYGANEKWTTGQQLEHIRQSINPLNLALNLPKSVLKMIFGKANRPSKTNEELITKYKLKLNQGGVAPRAFQPKKIKISDRSPLIEKVNKTIGSLSKKIGRLNEDDLDSIILPHPLLGKITLREMIYFTNYHVGHHHSIIKQNLG